MAKRATLYLIDRTLDITGDNESLSGRINSIVGRYDRIIGDSMPELSDNQWCAIFDANNGFYPADGGGPEIWANVADSPELAEKWGIDIEELVAKMRAMSVAERIAIAEANQVFWRNAGLPTRRALAIATRKSRNSKGERP